MTAAAERGLQNFSQAIRELLLTNLHAVQRQRVHGDLGQVIEQQLTSILQEVMPKARAECTVDEGTGAVDILLHIPEGSFCLECGMPSWGDHDPDCLRDLARAANEAAGVEPEPTGTIRFTVTATR